jgi:hypothetical protein
MKSIYKMIKFLKLGFNYLFVLIALSFLSACSTDKHEQEVYELLNNNQSKFIFKVDGKDFYQAESIFGGHLEIVEKSFTISFFDQYDSNVMIHFGGEKWYAERPIKVPIQLINSYTSPLMFGKIKNKEKRLGEGYLMSEGYITFKTLTKEKIIIQVDGKAKKYPQVSKEDKDYDVQALIVCKNPKIDFLEINEKEAFY